MDPITAFREFGFPALIAAIVVFRIEPAIRDQTKAIRDLKDVLLSLGNGELSTRLRERELERQRILAGSRMET